jgi:hypothetical protein
MKTHDKKYTVGRQTAPYIIDDEERIARKLVEES